MEGTQEWLRSFWHELTVELPRKPGLDVWNRDLPMVGVAVIAWTIVHYVFLNFLARPLGKRWVVASAPSKDSDSHVKLMTPSPKDYFKFETSLWKAFVYGSMFCFGVYSLWEEPYFLENAAVARGWPNKFPEKVELYYIITMGQYVHASVVIFWQPKQTDFVEMMLHHMATLFLLGFSYVSAWFEIGTRLIIITDSADPYMEIAKCFLYCGWHGAADALFAFFAVIFILTRVIAFPFYCIIPSINYRYVNNGGPVPFWTFNFVWVLTLYGIFLFWTFLILKMAWTIYIKGDDVRGDVRDEDYVGANEKKDKKKKQ